MTRFKGFVLKNPWELRVEILNWLRVNNIGYWIYGVDLDLYKEEEVTLFLLRWGDKICL